MLFKTKQLCLFISLVFLQVSFFSKIHLFGVATPLLYVYYIIQLPGNFSRNMVFLLAVLIGSFVDIFYHIWGLNLLSCVVVGFLRFYFLKKIALNDLRGKYSPSLVFLGKKRFFFYAFCMVFSHQTILFTVESFSFLDPFLLILQIIGSGCLTLFLIFVIELLKC